jgi:lysophospholipase L1-like esterase
MPNRSLILIAILISLTSIPFSAHSTGKSILIIGDSNTEKGLITTSLADTLRKFFGVTDTSTGYLPFNSAFYLITENRPLVPGISISYPNTWILYDMFEGSRLTPPFLSPNGHWLRTATQNATVTVTFRGNAVDVYWLADVLGGSFGITIDNQLKATVATAGVKSVQKTSVTGLSSTGNHTMLLASTTIPTQGKVTLLGFDAHIERAGQVGRPTVHNWGNGYCSTQDFINIDSTIFITGLQKLSPDYIVLLLGTNDHIQDQRSAADFKTNLKVIINRIKAAGLSAPLLMVSTFMTQGGNAEVLLPQYLATSWPQAASETNTPYWNMSTWYGPFNSAYMADVYHCNAVGGKKIADEMLRQIVARFPTVPVVDDHNCRRSRAPAITIRSNGMISFGADVRGPVTVELYNVNGRPVEKFSPAAVKDIFIDRHRLSNGIYPVVVRTGNERAYGVISPVR